MSRFLKSALRVNQNTAQISQQLSFVPLVSINKGQIQFKRQGLSLLQDQCSNKTYLIAYESNNSSFLYSIYRSNNVLDRQRTRSTIWITNFPRVDETTGQNYFYLCRECITQNLLGLFAICSLISSIVIVNVDQISNLEHLAGLDGRIVYSGNQKDVSRNRINRKNQIATLALIRKYRNKQIASDFYKDQAEIKEILIKNNIYDQCNSFYNKLCMFHTLSDSFDPSSADFTKKLEQSIKKIAIESFNKFQDLTVGPIMSEYLQNIIAAMNKGKAIDISQCQKQIKITQGYNAFTRAVDIYHTKLTRDLKDETGVSNLATLLNQHHQTALCQFKSHSNDALYMQRLQDYITTRQKEMTVENNKALQLTNLNFLKNQSKKIIDKVTREKLSEEEANRLIERMVEQYKIQSAGQNRFQLLTLSLNILHPQIHKIIWERQTKGIKREGDETKREKLQLQQRVNQLETEINRLRTRERERSSKCCQIM